METLDNKDDVMPLLAEAESLGMIPESSLNIIEMDESVLETLSIDERDIMMELIRLREEPAFGPPEESACCYCPTYPEEEEDTEREMYLPTCPEEEEDTEWETI